jgi:hypothetical protein
MTRRLLRVLVVLAGLVSAAPIARSQTPRPAPVFRSGTVLVTVAVSVKRGNTIVPNLTAADFRLTDNGVSQTIDAITVESVPIDATLFLDTSGSTAGKLDEMQRDVRAIVTMLRPGDRFRLLTIGDAVEQPVPWVDAGTRSTAVFKPVGGISLIHDALMFGLLHRLEPGRRHLIVGLTDRRDCGSVVPAAALLDAAARAEAVIHLVNYSGGTGKMSDRFRACTPQGAANGPDVILQAAERTGGELHTPSRLFAGTSVERAFRTVFSDFRQSYVLRYSPTGSDARGWHAIVVTVPAVTNATVRARQGYYKD